MARIPVTSLSGGSRVVFGDTTLTVWTVGISSRSTRVTWVERDESGKRGVARFLNDATVEVK